MLASTLSVFWKFSKSINLRFSILLIFAPDGLKTSSHQDPAHAAISLQGGISTAKSLQHHLLRTLCRDQGPLTPKNYWRSEPNRPLALSNVSINVHSSQQRCISGSQAPASCWTMPAVPDKDTNLQLQRAFFAKQKLSYICDICLEDAELML